MPITVKHPKGGLSVIEDTDLEAFKEKGYKELTDKEKKALNSEELEDGVEEKKEERKPL